MKPKIKDSQDMKQEWIRRLGEHYGEVSHQTVEKPPCGQQCSLNLYQSKNIDEEVCNVMNKSICNQNLYWSVAYRSVINKHQTCVRAGGPIKEARECWVVCSVQLGLWTCKSVRREHREKHCQDSWEQAMTHRFSRVAIYVAMCRASKLHPNSASPKTKTAPCH